MEFSSKVCISKIVFLILLSIKTCLCDVTPSASTPTPSTTPFVRLVKPIRLLVHGANITIEYQCHSPHAFLFRVALFSDDEPQTEITGFETTWTCSGYAATKLHKRISVDLPPKLAFKPSYWNQKSENIRAAFVYCWAFKQEIWTEELLRSLVSELTSRASTKIIHLVPYAPSYQRPDRPITVCYSWWAELNMQMRPYSPVCRKEKGLIVEGLSYPLALSGRSMGVHRILKPFSNPVLERQRKDSFTDPRFTIELWLYVEEYCPYSRRERCSILQRLSWDDYFNTPLIYITSQGLIRVTIVTENSGSFREFSDFTVPKREWVRLVMTFQHTEWTLTLNFGPDLQHLRKHEFSLPAGHRPWYDDTQNLHIFGGSEMVSTFKGFIGKATIYRGQSIPAKLLPLPPKDHPMFTITDHPTDRCRLYLDFYEFTVHKKYRMKSHRQRRMRKETCQDSVKELIFGLERESCRHFEGPIPKDFNKVKVMMERAMVNVDTTRELLGNQLFRAFLDSLTADSLKSSLPENLPLLEAGSCYGNLDATFTLATIYDQGIVVDKDKHYALQLLMKGAREKHRGCLMALGNKHGLGIDLPRDTEQGYAYYQGVAESTQDDMDSSTDKEVYPYHVRLTDDIAVEEHSGVEGDLYLYYKFQAEQGELFALKELARMTYWGTNGLQRNLSEAAGYYRRAAEREDPAALYDYGLILVKGHGVEQNMTLGVEILDKAADLGWAPALNTLGWYAMNEEQNYTRALNYFMRAYKLRNPDAACNLGHMHVTGKLPSGDADRLGAYEYFKHGAKWEQMDSMFWVAMYQMRGHPKAGPRDIDMALSWARYVSEKNPFVTHFLAEGLSSYKEHQWELSLFYYSLAAETGAEVALFNLAYICEQDYEDVSRLLPDECEYSNYNLSTQRYIHQVHPHAWIKMADFHVQNHDVERAARMYSTAALKGVPQAYYSLSTLVDSMRGNKHMEGVWRDLKIPYKTPRQIQKELLHRCQQSDDMEAFIVCSLPLLALYVQDIYLNYFIVLMAVSMVTSTVVIWQIVSSWQHQQQQQQQGVPAL